MTYLPTASICEFDDSCFSNTFQLENPFFVKAGSALNEVSIPLWSVFKQVWQEAASLLSSWCDHLNRSNHAVWNDPFVGLLLPKVFEILSWYGLSTFTKTWSGGLSCVFVVSSLQAIVVDGSKSFSFPASPLIRIVSSTTPGSVSQVYGFTHDKGVPYLFSTPQTRSQLQAEFLTHLMKKLAPVNDISGM